MVRRPAPRARTAPSARTAYSTSAADSARTTRRTAAAYGRTPQHQGSGELSRMAQAQVTRSKHAFTTFNLLNPRMNMNNGIARVAALLAMVGWGLIAPQPAQAQLLPPLPLPIGSLVVTVTSPADGSTVGGTVPVTASVTAVGALSVRGVQFKLDGTNLGAQDTT